MKSGLIRRFIGLACPPVLFCALDATFTLAGQSPAYFAGDHSHPNELSPTFHHLLQIHPLAFIAGIAVWAAMFTAIIILLPETVALAISIAVTFGHAVGAGTWLLNRPPYGYQLANGVALLAAIVLAGGIAVGYRHGLAYALNRWPMPLRFVLSALLFSGGVYLFLWPRSV